MKQSSLQQYFIKQREEIENFNWILLRFSLIKFKDYITIINTILKNIQQTEKNSQSKLLDKINFCIPTYFAVYRKVKIIKKPILPNLLLFYIPKKEKEIFENCCQQFQEFGKVITNLSTIEVEGFFNNSLNKKKIFNKNKKKKITEQQTQNFKKTNINNNKFKQFTVIKNGLFKGLRYSVIEKNKLTNMSRIKMFVFRNKEIIININCKNL